MSTYRLTCHCGAVELEVRLRNPDFSDASRCDCSFCRRRGAIMAAVKLDDLKVIKGETLRLYSFNTGTAQHYFCGTCGVYTHHKRRYDPNEYGINAGCLEGVNPRDLGDIPWVDGVNHPSDAP